MVKIEVIEVYTYINTGIITMTPWVNVSSGNIRIIKFSEILNLQGVLPSLLEVDVFENCTKIIVFSKQSPAFLETSASSIVY